MLHVFLDVKEAPEVNEGVDEQGGFEFIDFPSLFAEAGPGQELMWDHVHANPEGDDLIAEYYCKHLLATREIE